MLQLSYGCFVIILELTYGYLAVLNLAVAAILQYFGLAMVILKCCSLLSSPPYLQWSSSTAIYYFAVRQFNYGYLIVLLQLTCSYRVVQEFAILYFCNFLYSCTTTYLQLLRSISTQLELSCSTASYNFAMMHLTCSYLAVLQLCQNYLTVTQLSTLQY